MVSGRGVGGGMTVRKVTNSCRSVTTHGCFRNRRVRVVNYGAFESIVSAVGGSPSVLKVVTVRGAVTNDLLRGRRLVHRDNLRIVNRCGLHVSRSLITLPKAGVRSIGRIGSRPVTLVRYASFLSALPGTGIIRGRSATVDTQ